MKQTLYFIPGTQCDNRLWSRVLPYLDSEIEVVHLPIPNQLNFEQIAAHYQQQLGEEPVNLVGFSLGGYIASDFLARYPEQVNRIFIIANSPTALPENELKQRYAMRAFAEKNGYQGLSRKRVASLLSAQNRDESIIDCVLAMDKTLGAETFLSQFQHTTERCNLASYFNQYQGTAYFYYSEQDALIDKAWFQQLDLTRPQLKILTTENAGHMIPLEQPQALAQHLNNWVRDFT
ncbi:alpha/beta hydrolase [Catenovulum sp. SM1970]|uniref:alpha/beta fold hydrolase n=1 Tax=Marinifaba aquimaris TaxID=2741323 RepID=UPI001574ECC4|nr:alpha/beta hydrolase [Marinifaba aquimaris]NTS76321.1 alpha/beta hydrolase [Marinifaba aquimaris]